MEWLRTGQVEVLYSLARHARDAPQTPAEDLLTQDERAMIRGVRQAPSTAADGRARQTVRNGHKRHKSWVVLLARTVGWRPSKRRPYPGNEVLWRA